MRARLAGDSCGKALLAGGVLLERQCALSRCAVCCWLTCDASACWMSACQVRASFVWLLGCRKKIEPPGSSCTSTSMRLGIKCLLSWERCIHRCLHHKQSRAVEVTYCGGMHVTAAQASSVAAHTGAVSMGQQRLAHAKNERMLTGQRFCFPRAGANHSAVARVNLLWAVMVPL